ncbi:MAG: DUF885 domain-containing protein [Pseudomonadota bacterium]
MTVAVTATWASPTIAAERLEAIVADYDRVASQTDGDNPTGWPDVSLAAVAQRTTAYRSLQSRLTALPASRRDSEDALTRELLAWRLAIAIDGARFDEERIPFDNGDGFFNTANYVAANTVLHDEREARAWIARLATLPGYYAIEMANMRRGIASGFVQPRSIAEGILAVLRVAAEQPGEASPLLGPLQRLPSTLPAGLRAALLIDATRIVATNVKPAQHAMVEFFEKEYVPHARSAPGARSLPDGEAYYAYLVRRSTTLPLTPDEVYAMGETEVARLHGEMERAMRDTGFTGTLPEFVAMLRSEPKFYSPDVAAYVEKASEIGKRVDAMLPRWFGKLPRLSWGFRRKPPELEASSSGYDAGDPVAGVAGSVVIGARSNADPLFSLPSWVLHEGVPGHHLQIALAQERTDLPKFRRRDDITAFVEGWALYSEYLGEEMGVYRDAYERFGRLSFNIWRACRLMMDVGLHWKGWTVPQAEQCLRENTTLPERFVQYETQRYVAWPAQALAYKVGELRILAMRRAAERTLGDRFDIRAFHDALIDGGPMPLEVLERHMQSWAARVKKAPIGR